MFLEIPQNSQENTCTRVSFLIQLQAWTCNFIKRETLTQVFSCEHYEISKNTFFIKHLWWLLLNQKRFSFFYKPTISLRSKIRNCCYLCHFSNKRAFELINWLSQLVHQLWLDRINKHEAIEMLLPPDCNFYQL